jgi:hypothetical protein
LKISDPASVCCLSVVPSSLHLIFGLIILCRMSFSLRDHHCGSFTHVPHTHYVGGDAHVSYGLNEEMWSHLEVLDIMKELGFGRNVKFWWNKFEDVASTSSGN